MRTQLRTRQCDMLNDQLVYRLSTYFVRTCIFTDYYICTYLFLITFRFKNEEELIELANATPYGLAGYIYTENINQAWRIADELQVGMVGLNTGFVSTIELPFGGIKNSGIGREGGPNALHEFMDIKTITWDTSNN